MMLKHIDVFALLENVNLEDARSKCLGISYLDNVALYTVDMEGLPNVNRGASNFAKSRSRPAFLHKL